MPPSSYRSSPARLVRLFRASRDGWKQRVAAKQKEIRYLRVKVRDLEASRDAWKQRALQARPPLAEAAPVATAPPAGQAVAAPAAETPVGGP